MYTLILTSTMPRQILLVLIFSLAILRSSDGQFTDYCVADEQTPEDELQRAMDWACGNGADCSVLRLNQRCYLPNTTMAHASYAFNSYYQNMKHKGGSCYFRGAALLTGIDPSHDSCKFEELP